jgi:hypothetical protein
MNPYNTRFGQRSPPLKNRRGGPCRSCRRSCGPSREKHIASATAPGDCCFF